MEVAAKLVEIKAGLSTLVDNRLVSDPRKGKVEVIRDQDGLVHFTWSERHDSPLPPEVDIVLFPGNGTFSKLPGRRMFLLSHNGDEKLFFWAQEPDKGQDEQQCTTVNECINSFTADMDADGDDEDEAEEDMEDAEPAAALKADATAVEEAAEQPGPAPPEHPLSEPPEHGQGIQASDLARVLGSLGVPQASTVQPQQVSTSTGPATGSIDALALAAALAGAAGGSGAESLLHMQRAPGPSLAEVLTPEVLIPLVSEPGVLQRLSPHLPEEHRTKEGLVELAASAQLRHQLSLLSMALQTAQLDPSQFGLAPTGYTVLEFLESVQKKVDEEQKLDQ